MFQHSPSETPVPPALQNELLPLPAAARTIYERVYEHRDGVDPALLLERLDGVASVIACMADLYVREAAARVHHRVSPYDVHTGSFRNGGNELCFKDGRAPITDMLVTRSGLESVLSLLEKTKILDCEHEQPERNARQGSY